MWQNKIKSKKKNINLVQKRNIQLILIDWIRSLLIGNFFFYKITIIKLGNQLQTPIANLNSPRTLYKYFIKLFRLEDYNCMEPSQYCPPLMTHSVELFSIHRRQDFDDNICAISSIGREEGVEGTTEQGDKRERGEGWTHFFCHRRFHRQKKKIKFYFPILKLGSKKEINHWLMFLHNFFYIFPSDSSPHIPSLAQIRCIYMIVMK